MRAARRRPRVSSAHRDAGRPSRGAPRSHAGRALRRPGRAGSARARSAPTARLGSARAADRDAAPGPRRLAPEMARDASAADGDADDAEGVGFGLESSRSVGRNARRLLRARALAPALARDGDGGFMNASAFQEHHLVCDALARAIYREQRGGSVSSARCSATFPSCAKLETGSRTRLSRRLRSRARAPLPTPAVAGGVGRRRRAAGSRAYFAAKRVAARRSGARVRVAAARPGGLPEVDGRRRGRTRSSGDVVAYGTWSRTCRWGPEIARHPAGGHERAGRLRAGGGRGQSRRLAPPPRARLAVPPTSRARRVRRAPHFRRAAPGEAFLPFSARIAPCGGAEFRDAEPRRAGHARVLARRRRVRDRGRGRPRGRGARRRASARRGCAAARGDLRGGHPRRAPRRRRRLRWDEDARRTSFRRRRLRARRARGDRLAGRHRPRLARGGRAGRRACDVLVHRAEGRAPS